MVTRRVFGLGALALGGALAGRVSAAESADVLVIGAGLAGLYSALLLEEAGFKPLVLEAQQRIGGRMLTLDHLPGKPEAGGRTLSNGYGRAVYLMDRFGLARAPAPRPGPSAIAYKGAVMSAADWPKAAANPLGERWRALAPGQLYGRAMHELNPLSDPAAWRETASLPHDARSVAQELAARGVEPAAIDLMRVTFDGPSMEAMSALFAFRKQSISDMEGTLGAFRIAGGSSRLPEAMAGALTSQPRLGRQVVAIDADATGVEARCLDGSVYRARFAIVALPYSVLRTIRMTPAPPPAQDLAIKTLPYGAITQVEMTVERPFWEADGLPPDMWTDTAIERLSLNRDAGGAPTTLNAWINGEAAMAFDALDREAGARLVVDTLERLRPASKGLVKVVSAVSWGNDPFALGSYHCWGPGQVRAFGGEAMAPLGPLRFVGEHASEVMQGMEGALESAERETTALMDLL